MSNTAPEPTPTMTPEELAEWERQMRGEDCCALNKPTRSNPADLYRCPVCRKLWVYQQFGGQWGFEEVL